LITRRQNSFLRRHLRMQMHVVLRMRLEVLAIPAHRHPLERQPTVARLGLMAEQHQMLTIEVRNDRLEQQVMRHDIAAVHIAELHADVLPDLDPDRALRNGCIDVPHYASTPAWVLKSRHREGGGERHATWITLAQRYGIQLLVANWRVVGGV